MLKELSAWKNSDKICLCSHWAAGEFLPPFCVYARHVAAVAVEVRDVAKSSEKALVKRFCEKNFTEFLLDLKKLVAFFIFPRYSERLFELKNSEFGCEINF